MTTVDRAQRPAPHRPHSPRGGRATSSSPPSSASSSASCSSSGTRSTRPSASCSRPSSRTGCTAMWLVPAVLAPLIIRKPGRGAVRGDGRRQRFGAARQPVGPGHAALRLHAGRRRGARLRARPATGAGRSWCSRVAALAAAVGRVGPRLVASTTRTSRSSSRWSRLAIMGASAIGFAAFGSLALERSLRRAGVLDGLRRPERQRHRPRRPGRSGRRARPSPTPGARGRRSATSSSRSSPGSVLLVVGPSGSGKSTVARALAGLLPSAVPGEWRGSLRVGDIEVARRSSGPDDDRRRRSRRRGSGPGSSSRTRRASWSWSGSGTTWPSGWRTSAGRWSRCGRACPRRSPRSASRASRTAARPGCPAASSSASRSRACWRRPRACWSSTSRRRTSIRKARRR